MPKMDVEALAEMAEERRERIDISLESLEASIREIANPQLEDLSPFEREKLIQDVKECIFERRTRRMAEIASKGDFDPTKRIPPPPIPQLPPSQDPRLQRGSPTRRRCSFHGTRGDSGKTPYVGAGGSPAKKLEGKKDNKSDSSRDFETWMDLHDNY